MTSDPPGRPAAPPPTAIAALRQVAGLAWPALAQQGLLLAVQLYDQYLTGRFSPAHQAALTTANYVYWFVTAYAVVVTAGATAVVGRLVGAGDPAAARAAGQVLVLAAGFGTAGAAALWAGAGRVAAGLNLAGPAVGPAADYLAALAVLLPVYLVEAGGIACLVGAGDTRTGLKALAVVAAVNVPLAWGLSHGTGPLPDLGFVGIAYGTGLSHAVGCGLVLATLARGRYGLRLSVRHLAPEPVLLYRLLRVSLPAAADSLSVGLFQFVFLAVINRLGETASAAHGIALRVEGMGYLSGAAFGTAVAALVGRQLGAGRPDLAARGGWAAFALGAAVMSAMGAVFFLYAEPLFRLFSRGHGQAGVVAAGVPVLRLVAFAMPGLAASMVLTQALRAAGDTRVPVLFTWAGFLGVRLPLAWYLTGPDVGYGLYGAWVAMFADIHVRGAMVVARFAGGRWKAVRV